MLLLGVITQKDGAGELRDPGLLPPWCLQTQQMDLLFADRKTR